MDTSTAANFVIQQAQQLEKIKMDGSSEFPYIIIVDPEKPESNWGFEVSRIVGMEHRNYTRDAFHIRRVTTVSQEEQWEATVPAKKYPALAHRAP